MAARQVEESVEEIVAGLLEGQDVIELVDVEYVKERDWYLRVFIDREGGIEIDDCQNLSERLEEELDKRDIIPDSYILEVSSPGLDRVLKKDRDFQREMGKTVDVSLYAPMDGKKLLVGTLTAYGDGKITLDESQEISMDKVSQVRLHIDF
ncbi:MAG: ribosome maturation factor RimP [Selenomonadaceae bacterium]|nr:ribosome maturation factor RimP [Selenomonadaceae bacterium]MBQ1509298.1 ribosome maturation factor RimP [Selenomonadaceae bacterium]MBQ1915813.1 ribosome maturation factor RimP [Selenomonadaceae bacterium]MBQ3971669.1 ribosome maturation factor RimP [Selenomonadaceae bacterium]